MDETAAAGVKPLSEQKCITARKRKNEPEKLPEMTKEDRPRIVVSSERNRTLRGVNFSLRSFIEKTIVKVMIVRKMKAEKL
jgi:hypothetical protein